MRFGFLSVEGKQQYERFELKNRTIIFLSFFQTQKPKLITLIEEEEETSFVQKEKKNGFSIILIQFGFIFSWKRRNRFHNYKKKFLGFDSISNLPYKL